MDFMEQQSDSQQTELHSNDTEQNSCRSWKNRLYEVWSKQSAPTVTGLFQALQLYFSSIPT